MSRRMAQSGNYSSCCCENYRTKREWNAFGYFFVFLVEWDLIVHFEDQQHAIAAQGIEECVLAVIIINKRPK